MQVRGRALHFGVHVQGQRTDWREYVRSVQAIEDLGYGSIWTFDHLLPFSGDVGGACFETLTTLGALCSTTARARLGTLVHGVVYRHPAILAKALAQVDQMSGGRLECSLGAGWAEQEFHAYGMEFPSLAERYARLEEAMQLVKLLWTEPRVTFRGRYYNADNAPCEPSLSSAPILRLRSVAPAWVPCGWRRDTPTGLMSSRHRRNVATLGPHCDGCAKTLAGTLMI